MLVFCKQFIGAFSVKKLIVLIGFLMCLDARAGIIDFDDSFIAGVGLGTVAGPSNSYEGFSWSYIHSLTNFPNTGYALVQQGARVAYSWDNSGLAQFSRTDNSLFNVNGGRFAAAFSPQVVTFQGLLNGVVVESLSAALSNTVVSNLNFSFTGIDTFRFTGTTNQVAFDNLDVSFGGVGGQVPLPSTIALLGLGLISLRLRFS
jgi:hypothetical protein